MDVPIHRLFSTAYGTRNAVRLFVRRDSVKCVRRLCNGIPQLMDDQRGLADEDQDAQDKLLLQFLRFWIA